MASSLAGTLAAGPARVLGSNDRIRLGLIGAGDRGMELLHHIRACPYAEVAACADVYTRRLEKVSAMVPGAALHRDFRRLLDDASIDAVVIATPSHSHADHFCAALGAGRHVYLEGPAAFSIEHAKRMREAFRQDAGSHTVQIGHQCCSFGHMSDVQQFLSSPERMGKITAIVMHLYRNTPRGKPHGARPAMLTADVNPENVLWKSFLGDAPSRDFDPNRFINWRMFWDYSGGAVSENMSHQLSFWYKALDLQIPRSAAMRGGIYLWKDGREVPDTAGVALEQSEELLISWSSGLGNSRLGVSEDVLGENGSIERRAQVRYLPQRVNRPDGVETLGRATHVAHVHMQDFLESIRGAKQPNCSFDLGFRVSIACRMAVESYRRGRPVRWDPNREEIV